MSFQWVGVLSFTLFSIHFLFTVAGLLFLRKALMIISLSFLERTNSHIFKPIFFLFSYALIWMLFKQAISFKIITFTYESTELIINLALSLIYVAVAFSLLFKILKDSKVLETNRGK